MVTVPVLGIGKIDFNREFIETQSLEVGLSRQTVTDLLLEICFGLNINIQLTLQDFSLLLRLVVKVYFGPK